MRNLDDFYINIAYDVAALSRCAKRKVGAVAIKGNSILDFGFNGTPYGWITNTCEDQNGNTTDAVVHAEENIVAKSARSGRSLNQSTVYITYAPCMRCARLLYQAGVDKVVYVEDNNKGGVEMLRRLGVIVERWQSG